MSYKRSLLAVAVVVASIGSIAQAREFRSYDVLGPELPQGRAVTQMGNALNERTNGRIVIKTEKQTITDQQVMEKLKSGEIEMARLSTATYNGLVPETAVLALPFIYRSKEHYRNVLDSSIGEEVLKALESQGVIALCFYDAGARSFYNNKKPIKTPADMKGMKIRVQQSEMFKGLVTALGAEPVALPFNDVYAALKDGKIDGAENNWPSYESTKHYEVAKYYTLNEHSMVPEILLFSKKVWETLSKEDQAAIRKAAKESVPYERKLWDVQEQKSRRAVEAAGVQVVSYVYKPIFVDAVKPFYEKFVTDPKLKDMVKRIRRVQ